MQYTNITLALSPRYQRLACEVLDRLPAGWNGSRIVRLEESSEIVYLTPGRMAVAYAARLQFKSDELWVVTLYTSSLDDLSDEAMRWIVARELARVTADPSRTRPRRRSRLLIQQDNTEAVALGWGFSEEYRQFEKEYELPKAS